MRSKVRGFLAAVAVALVAAACASDGTTGSPVTRVSPATSAMPVQEAMPPEDYRIGALDLLDIKVFMIEELDRTVRVDQKGQVALPLIGAVVAGGRTVMELQSEIEALYGATYLQSPRVSVFIKEYASQRIAIAGAVVEPGMFFLNGPTTLLEAVSLARGPSDVASTSDIALIRTIDGQRVGAFYDLDAIIMGEQTDPRVAGGDIIYVQASGFRQTMKEIMTAAPILAVIRPF